MTIVRFTIIDEIEPTDTDRSIEQAAENIKQSIIAEYYNQTNENPEEPVQHDRIIITAGAVTID